MARYLSKYDETQSDLFSQTHNNNNRRRYVYAQIKWFGDRSTVYPIFRSETIRVDLPGHINLVSPPVYILKSPFKTGYRCDSLSIAFKSAKAA